MTVTEQNVKITAPWITRACTQQERIFCMLTIKKTGEVQLYQTGEISQEDFIKQLRYIADTLEKGKVKLKAL